MRILIATDAWHPQVNGVVRSLDTTRHYLEDMGHTVRIIEPGSFSGFRAPGYPEVRLALPTQRRLDRLIREFNPDAIHIPVEGPIGLAARRWCRRNNVTFTSSYHTRFGDFFAHQFGFGARQASAFQAWFHRRSAAFMVTTRRLEQELGQDGYRNIVRWSRGVDLSLFRPMRDVPDFDMDFLDVPRPIFLYLGRVSREKNLEAFLDLDLPGTKVVVGGGPQLEEYRQTYEKAVFTGPKHGDDIARHLSAADVFVFPSRFDTFGLVVLESLACGTPVAAFPVRGPIDIVGDTECGVLSEDLREAALAALSLDRKKARALAETYSWEASTRQFLANLVPVVPDRAPAISAA